MATLVLGLGYGAIHWLAVLGGGAPLIGFVALLLGVSTWTWVLRGLIGAAPPISAA